MLQPAKVATPPTAVTGLAVQTRLAAVGVLIANVTELVSVVTLLPAASWTATAGCTAKAAVLAAPTGWVAKPSLAAGPGVMTNELLTAAVNVPSVAVRVYVAAKSMLQPAKVAT